MIVLKRSGFFRELPYGDATGPSLLDLRSGSIQPDESNIVSYLEKGVPFIFSPGIVEDILDGRCGIIGTGSIRTDGEWAWPDDLPHYIVHHHIRLPENFIEHMRRLRWIPPPEDELDLGSLTL